MPSADVSEPWVSMGIDGNGGSVVYSDDSSLSVMFEGVDLKSKVESAIQQLDAAGCVKQMDMIEAQGSYSYSCKLGEKTIGIGGTEAGSSQVIGYSYY